MRAIHWFRRDLRISDNTALAAANARCDEVVAAYVLSDWKKSHRWTGAARQQFLCGSLASLSKNIEAIGGSLVLRCGSAVRELEKLVVETGADAIYYNRDPDPFGWKMEKMVAAMAARHGCEVHSFKDVALHERDEVLKDDGTPYRVFTPYSKSWSKLDKPPPRGKVRKLAAPAGIKSLPPPTLDHWGIKANADPVEAGEAAARKRLSAFLDGTINRYANDRNIPYGRTTSRLSQDLRLGLLSIREIHSRCRDRLKTARGNSRRGIQCFINELCWREFYFQILWHFPDVLEVEFNEKYRELAWDGDGEAFERWKSGTTGFPIVDAGMRELNATGFMHNRLRMITAMFLTKDLHINWRLGEQYFMQRLTDGEIASNNGGWQWSAGTGADAAPYFRIQNPWTQSDRFDKQGKYIRQWLPELENVPTNSLHSPPADTRPIADGYPLPMVDHSEERRKTLEMFRQDG